VLPRGHGCEEEDRSPEEARSRATLNSGLNSGLAPGSGLRSPLSRVVALLVSPVMSPDIEFSKIDFPVLFVYLNHTPCLLI